MWKKVTVVALPLIGVLMAVNLLGDHPHGHAATYPYLRKRDKAFPWADSDCTLFDMECKRASAAARAAGEA